MKWKPRFIKTVILLAFLSLIALLNAQEPPKDEAKKYTHSLALHPRVPKNIYQTVINAVLKFSQDKTNHEMLDRIQMLEPVKASYQNDYMPIEKLSSDKNIK